MTEKADSGSDHPVTGRHITDQDTPCCGGNTCGTGRSGSLYGILAGSKVKWFSPDHLILVVILALILLLLVVYRTFWFF